MRILIAHCVPRTRNNGMSRMMGFLHDPMVRQGHEVDYFCVEDAFGGRKIYSGLYRLLFPLAVLRHVLTAARGDRPYDIVNIHEPSAAAVALARPVLGKTKVVVTSHGLERRNWKMRTAPFAEPADRPSTKTRWIYPPTLLWQAEIALRAADHVFCLNSEDRSYLFEHYGRNSGNVTRMFPAADPSFGRRAGQRDYASHRRLLFAGSWLVRKGTTDLVAAFTTLVRQDGTISLTLLNPGAPAETILEQFPEDVRARVVFRSTVCESETVSVFEECDLFVLPSLFEGTPLTLIEAMWSGLPIISTETCGMRDVLQNECNGLLVPPRNASALTAVLSRLMRDPVLRERIGKQAHLDAAIKFRWDVVAEPVLASYLRLLSRNEEWHRERSPAIHPRLERDPALDPVQGMTVRPSGSKQRSLDTDA